MNLPSRALSGALEEPEELRDVECAAHLYLIVRVGFSANTQ
jgi:hypothetical protein